MLLITMEDFWQKARSVPRMTRKEELACARLMQAGQPEGRERLILRCLPLIAGIIRRYPPEYHTLGLVYQCLRAAERAVDSFPFEQESETFVHRLSWHLKQAVTRYIAFSREGCYDRSPRS